MPVIDTLPQLICLLMAALSVVSSFVLAVRQRYRLALLLLTLGGFCLYAYAAQLCGFLNVWDEQYHALVAKNMLDYPFAPQLFKDEVLQGHDYTLWVGGHIWLHKQPFFLWEIALSYKLFGVSEFTLRLPSVLHCTLLIPVCYRIAQLLTDNHVTAFLTAVCAAGSCFLLKLAAGLLNTDHNDVCFVFLVTASVWALLEYLHSDRKKLLWALLAGFLSGTAILTKWLVGLLVYLAWGIFLVAEYGIRIRQWKIGHILLALLVTALVAVPWQIYTLKTFPIVAQHELLYNSQHFTTAIENHGASPLFYIQVLPFHFFGHGYKTYLSGFQWNFATIVSYVVLLVGQVMLLISLKKRSHRITLLGVTIFIYVFFGIAGTKMVAFTFVLCCIGFMSIATLLHFLFRQLRRVVSNRVVLQIIIVVAGLLLFYYQTNIQGIMNGCPRYMREGYVHNRGIYQRWAKCTPDSCYIFNVNGNDGMHYSYTTYVAAMFYSGRQCYAELPTLDQLHQIQRDGNTVAIVHNAVTPTEYLNDSTLLHLPDSISFY